MTVDKILERARWVLFRSTGPYADPGYRELARAIVEQLGESQPCGMEPPTVINGLVLLDGEELTASEIRAICAVYLRCADEAEAQATTKGDRDAKQS